MAEQVERAYQKQKGVFVAKKSVFLKKKSKADNRWYMSMGLGIKTPKEAIEGTYVDKKCPFTSDVSVRGRILKGVIKSANKMKRTVIIRRDYLHFLRKYNRYEKRHKNLAAHCSPAFRVEEGDQVVVGECRPLSKTVTFNVLSVNSRSGKDGVKGFSKF